MVVDKALSVLPVSELPVSDLGPGAPPIDGLQAAIASLAGGLNDTLVSGMDRFFDDLWGVTDDLFSGDW